MKCRQKCQGDPVIGWVTGRKAIGAELTQPPNPQKKGPVGGRPTADRNVKGTPGRGWAQEKRNGGPAAFGRATPFLFCRGNPLPFPLHFCLHFIRRSVVNHYNFSNLNANANANANAKVMLNLFLLQHQYFRSHLDGVHRSARDPLDISVCISYGDPWRIIIIFLSHHTLDIHTL